jgi:hypothetical protein
MRKLLMLSVVTILPAFGCTCITEPIRRIEVWKQQTFFTAPQPVVAAPYGAVCGGAPQAVAPCGQAAEIGCGQTADVGCGQPMGIPAASGYAPGTVIADPPEDTLPEQTLPGPILTEESDGVLKQP